LVTGWKTKKKKPTLGAGGKKLGSLAHEGKIQRDCPKEECEGTHKFENQSKGGQLKQYRRGRENVGVIGKVWTGGGNLGNGGKVLPCTENFFETWKKTCQGRSQTSTFGKKTETLKENVLHTVMKHIQGNIPTFLTLGLGTRAEKGGGNGWRRGGGRKFESVSAVTGVVSYVVGKKKLVAAQTIANHISSEGKVCKKRSILAGGGVKSS